MSRFSTVVGAILIGVALAGASSAGADDAPKTVAFQRLVTRLRLNGYSQGIVCADNQGSVQGPQTDVPVDVFRDDFKSEFKLAGLQPEEEKNLFEDSNQSSAPYALAGELTKLKITSCFPYITSSGSLTVQWQLYSRLDRKVIAKVETTATASELGHDDTISLLHSMMKSSFMQLAGNPSIRLALNGSAVDADAVVKPTPNDPIVVSRTQPIPLDQAAKSVVVIYAGNALGSGVLISRDGYILTDAHVVAQASEVRLRWADGKESPAQVVRISTARDVALLKTEPSGHTPLPLKDTPPAVGSTVYAIGSPEGAQFQGTLTRGVVSALRAMNGLNYIQSDVTTGHGGSGGPLLDEKGYVVGLTDLGVGHDATSSGLNFFTPIKDTIEFLGLDLR